MKCSVFTLNKVGMPFISQNEMSTRHILMSSCALVVAEPLAKAASPYLESCSFRAAFHEADDDAQ